MIYIYIVAAGQVEFRGYSTLIGKAVFVEEVFEGIAVTFSVMTDY